MDLTLILGPMKSSKSFHLINYFAPLKYTKTGFGLFQSTVNVRDEKIWSRNGLEMEAKKITSLSEIADKKLDIIGIDEIHFFPESEADNIKALLENGVKVMVAGLPTDYRGKLFNIIKRLMELGPKKIHYLRAVCELCREPDAIYTQVLDGKIPQTEGLPELIPDDGTYNYMPVCRHCFIS